MRGTVTKTAQNTMQLTQSRRTKVGKHACEKCDMKKRDILASLTGRFKLWKDKETVLGASNHQHIIVAQKGFKDG